MVIINNLSVSFNNDKNQFHAVSNANLKITDGEIFGIVGTSGAGKSTLLRTVNLLQKPSSGSIVIDDKDITNIKGNDLRKIRLSIGMVFQHFNLLNSKTVYENIALPLRIAGEKKDVIRSRVPELLELVGLSQKANEFPSKLSGGQKQRVGIARALANKPKILLCDEPTSALDLETTSAILDLLRDINQKFGITIILISHEMSVIKKICTKVAVMTNSCIVETDDVFNIFSNPVHSFTKQLVKHTLDLDLPERLLNDVNGSIVKVLYRGVDAEKPVISETLKSNNVNINVLHGKIEYINNQPLGILLLSISGNKEEVTRSIAYLKNRTASVEVIYG